MKVSSPWSAADDAMPYAALLTTFLILREDNVPVDHLHGMAYSTPHIDESLIHLTLKGLINRSNGCFDHQPHLNFMDGLSFLGLLERPWQAANCTHSTGGSHLCRS